MAVMTVTTVLAGTVLYGCGGGGGSSDYNVRPAFLSGAIATTALDGVSDDLLTGGLGLTGLLAAAPAYANPAAPTASELRRNAIHANYRAVLDFTALGGFGSLYGPNIDVNGNLRSNVDPAALTGEQGGPA